MLPLILRYHYAYAMPLRLLYAARHADDGAIAYAFRYGFRALRY